MSGWDAFTGVRVIPTDLLPIEPSWGEQIRRRVRHGLADVLEWLGEDVGPAQHAETQAIGTLGGLMVSRDLHRRLVEQLATTRPAAEAVGESEKS